MSGLPILPLFVREYLVDTQHLTPEESGAYLHLMMQAWVTSDCSLPNDDAQLARLARVSPERWPEIRSTVLAFWTVKRGRLIQRRLSEEFRKTIDKTERRRRAGQKGGRASRSKQKEISPSNASAIVDDCSSNHNHNHNHKDSSPTAQNPDDAAGAGAREAARRWTRSEIDEVERTVLEAGATGGLSPVWPDISPIIGLIDAGYDLEADILPKIREITARRGEPVGSPAYFVKPIQEAGTRRRKIAADGVVPIRPDDPAGRRGDPYAGRVDMDALRQWAREEDERNRKVEAER